MFKHLRAGERRKLARNLRESIGTIQMGVAALSVMRFMLPLFVLFGLGAVASAIDWHNVGHVSTLGMSIVPVAGTMLQPFTVRRVPAEYFEEDTEIPFNLPLNGKITKGYVVLEGDIVISAGTTSGTLKGEGGPINLIKKIVVRANPAAGSRYFGGEIVNCTPRSLMRYAILQRSKFLKELTATADQDLGDGDAATYTVYCAIPIYFADPNILRQFTTSLNADPHAYQSIQVIVHTGNITDCFTGNDRTVDYSKLKVRWFDERHDFDGDTLCLYQEDHKALIPAAKEDFTDGAIKTDGAFLQWLIMAESTAANTLVDTLLNKVKIEGNGVAFDLEAQDLQQKMFDDGWYDVAQSAAGQYLIDFTDGNIFKAVPAAGLTAQFDVNMVGAANTDGLRFFSKRYFPPVGFDPTKPMKEYAAK